MTMDSTQAVKSHIELDRSLLNTSIPARIVSYNPVTQNATVQPLLQTLLKDGRLIDPPRVEDVPVMFPSAGASMITFPLTQGDSVLLVFSQRSLDNWQHSFNTDLVNTGDFRKHDISDAIVIPGIFSFPRAINDPAKHNLTHNTNDTVVTHNIGTPQQNEVRLKKSGNLEIRAGNGSTIVMDLNGQIHITAPTMLVDVPSTTWNGNVNLNGNITQQGNLNQTGATTSSVSVTAPLVEADNSLTIDGVEMKGHVHDGVTAGIDNSGAPL